MRAFFPKFFFEFRRIASLLSRYDRVGYLFCQSTAAQLFDPYIYVCLIASRLPAYFDTSRTSIVCFPIVVFRTIPSTKHDELVKEMWFQPHFSSFY